MTADDLAISQVFSEHGPQGRIPKLQGGKAEVVFGSVDIDFRTAKLAGDQATSSCPSSATSTSSSPVWQVVLSRDARPRLDKEPQRTIPDTPRTGDSAYSWIGRVRLDRGQEVGRP